MALFVISYDLHVRRDYARIIHRLRSTGAVKALESTWLAETNATAAAVRDDLKQYVDSDDTLLILELKPGSGWAARNMNQEAVDWLKLRL